MDAKNLKVGIIGMGPIGQTIAVHLEKAGCKVFVCDINKKKMNLIREEGIELVGKIEKSVYFKYVYTSVSELLRQDIDLLVSAVKAYHVDTILEQIEKANKDLIVLCAQNGIDIKVKYTSLFQDSKILRMVINFAGNLNAPNVVNVTFFNPPNYVASIDDTEEEMPKLISDILTSQGLRTQCVDSFKISEESWYKTILNAALSPLCAISRLTMKEAMTDTDTIEIAEQIIIEAVEVARAEEINFEPNFVKLCLRYLKKTGDHFPSLAVDLMNKRKTEIDYMNGKFVEYGRKHYIRTPMNLVFTNLVKAITKKNDSFNNSKK